MENQYKLKSDYNLLEIYKDELKKRKRTKFFIDLFIGTMIIFNITSLFIGDIHYYFALSNILFYSLYGFNTFNWLVRGHYQKIKEIENEIVELELMQ